MISQSCSGAPVGAWKDAVGVKRKVRVMRVGVPKEIKTLEQRVGLTPTSVREVVAHGHSVLVETNAGIGIGADDADEVAPAGLPGDVGAGSGWDARPIVVDAGGNVSETTTGTITLPAGRELRGAIVISTGTGAGDGVGTINWQARATNSNN